MGVGNSKAHTTEEYGQRGQSPRHQTPGYQQEPVAHAMLNGINHNTKRPRDLELALDKSNKKLKRPDSSNSLLQQELATGSIHSPGPAPRQPVLHDPGENTALGAKTSARAAVNHADEKQTAEPNCRADPIPAFQYHDAFEGLESLEITSEPNDEALLDQKRSPATTGKLVSSPLVGDRHHYNQSPSRNGTVSPCTSTSELSQQMESQVSQASQAIVEAAASSRDLENAVLSGWKHTSVSSPLRRQREQNRRLLRVASHALRTIADSEVFSSSSLARSTTSFQALQELLGQTPYLRRGPRSTDDASEVDFVTVTSQDMHYETQVARTTMVDNPDSGNTVAVHIPDSIAILRVREGCQRQLVGYWRGWEEGINSWRPLL